MSRTRTLALVLAAAFLLVGCTAEPPAPPTENPVGQWGEIGERRAYLTILDDGTVTGNDGCNGMGGKWAVVDGVVQFSEMLSTLMMCPNMNSGLNGPVVSAIVKGDTIHLLDEGGDVSDTLPRVASD